MKNNETNNAAQRAALLEFADGATPDALERILRPLRKVILTLRKRLLLSTLAKRLGQPPINVAITADELQGCIARWETPPVPRKRKSTVATKPASKTAPATSVTASATTAAVAAPTT
ncbi:MAG: hypothetical protein Q7S40_28370 [Opitutaceae bacterium]|nr:hypothetical protein [Opitutaceae bacterium]